MSTLMDLILSPKCVRTLSHGIYTFCVVLYLLCLCFLCLQLTLVHHITVAQPHSLDALYAAEAEAQALTIAQV